MVAGGERLVDLVQQRVAQPPVWPSLAGSQAVLLGARRLLVENIRARLEELIKEN